MKRVAFLNFFPAFDPPRSGGELRYWNLARGLSDSFDVRMVNPTHADSKREVVEHAARCRELRVPKTTRYLHWHRLLHRMGGFEECSALVTSLVGPRQPELARPARRLARAADIVIHSCPFLAEVYPLPRKGQLLVYDAYNVEALLAREMYGTGLWGRWAAARTRRLEGGLARRAHLVLTCSQQDADTMARLYRLDESKIAVVPNGVDTDSIRPPRNEEDRRQARLRLGLSGHRPALLFMGSFHPPNMEAARFLIGSLAPQLPEADLLIAGKVCGGLGASPLPPNVRLLGPFDEQTRADLLAGCDLALNPMASGSGTNLKMLDFLSAGLPVVSTPIGARGLDLRDGSDLLICSRSHFSHRVREALGDPSLIQTLSTRSRQLAETMFSWRRIAGELIGLLEHKTSRRILVLNDFPMSPVDLGGKARLQALSQRLAREVAPVTVLTLTKQEKGGRTSHGGGLEELNIRRSALHNQVDRAVAFLLGGVAADDLTAYLFHRLTPRFRQALDREMPWTAMVLLFHVYSCSVARKLPRQIPLLLDSCNVEAVLKQALYPRSPIGRLLARLVRKAEAEATRRACLVSCVSQADYELYGDLYGVSEEKMLLAENGVDSRRLAPRDPAERRRLRRMAGLGGEPAVLFLASGHPPNAHAARFLMEEVAPSLPGCLFLVAGSVCGWFDPAEVRENVLLLGVVREDVKDFLVLCSDVAVNPVFEGSGTSIKVLEYLSAGLPVVSTPVGARGIGDASSAHMSVCGADRFVRELRAILQDPDRYAAMGQMGRSLAETRFDWDVTLRQLLRRASELLPDQRLPEDLNRAKRETPRDAAC